MLSSGQVGCLVASGIGDVPCERAVARVLHGYCVMSVFSFRLRHRWIRLRRNEDGITAVEFGFVAIPFLILFMGLLEVGLVFFGNMTIEHAVTEASRLIRTGQAQTQGLNASGFKDKVCDHVNGLLPGQCRGVFRQRFLSSSLSFALTAFLARIAVPCSRLIYACATLGAR